jgi:type III secretion protein Q
MNTESKSKTTRNIKSISEKERIIRNKIGSGLFFNFASNNETYKLTLNLADKYMSSDYSLLESSYGTIEINNAQFLLNFMSSYPAPIDISFASEEDFFWDLFNYNLINEFKVLFGFLKITDQENDKSHIHRYFITTKLTIQDDKDCYHFKLKASLNTIFLLVNSSVWKKVKPKNYEFNYRMPITLAKCYLTMEQIYNLCPGEILVPTIPLFKTSGEGCIYVGSKTVKVRISCNNNNLFFTIKSIQNMTDNITLSVPDENVSDTIEQMVSDSTFMLQPNIEVADNYDFIEKEEVNLNIRLKPNDIKLDLHIRCGDLSMPYPDLLHLSQGSILTPTAFTPNDAKLFYKEQIIADGELINVDEKLCFLVNNVLLNHSKES